MSRFTLENLYDQRTVLLNVIHQEDTKKTELAGKLTRLEKASTSLQSHIEAIEHSCKKITDLSIDEGRWRGTEKDKFDKSHQGLENSAKEFFNQTEDARNRVEEEISRCQTNIASIEGQISHFRSVLANVNSQIETRRNN